MTDRERKLSLYVDQLVMEREHLRGLTRMLEQEKLALQAYIARMETQAERARVKDTFRGMEGL